MSSCKECTETAFPKEGRLIHETKSSGGIMSIKWDCIQASHSNIHVRTSIIISNRSSSSKSAYMNHPFNLLSYFY